MRNKEFSFVIDSENSSLTMEDTYVVESMCSDCIMNEKKTYFNILTMDVSNISYPGNITMPAMWEVIVKIMFYIPVILLAIVGNITIIMVVARDQRLRTTTNYYIVNLAVADCLVILSCSWVHLVDSITPQWVLGAFFCKFNTFAQG